MELDPGIYIVMHSVLFLKPGVIVRFKCIALSQNPSLRRLKEKETKPKDLHVSV